ncbi:uncharacterized protein LOC144144145 [Haemaphysalis longicornis]
MPPIRCLVSVPPSETRGALTLEDSSLECLQRAIAVFPVLGSAVDPWRCRFQILDPTFNEYVDLAPGEELPDMAKIVALQVQAQARSSEAALLSSSEFQEEVPGVASTFLEKENDPVAINTRSFIGAHVVVGVPGAIIACELPAESDDDGNTFTLPSLGSLKDVIMDPDKITSSVCREITSIVFDAMVKVSIVPTRKFYTRVRRMLVTEHPTLRDVVGTGYDSWKEDLRDRYKNLRRTLEKDARVAANKQKFGSKKTRKRTEQDMPELQRNKKLKLAVTTALLAGEDEASLNSHEEWLLKECRKSAPDEEQMVGRMDLTASSRLLQVPSMSFAEIKRKYPYLLEFERVSGTVVLSVRSCDKMSKFVNRKALLPHMSLVMMLY